MYSTRLLGLTMLGVLALRPAMAQSPAANQIASPVTKLSPEQQADSDGLRAVAKAAPTLPMQRVELKITGAPFKMGPVSAATEDKAGNFYILHRPAEPTIDPVVVVDPTGKYLRSFGKGLYAIPHGIRIDPEGNVWTVDAHTSMIYKFTPEGKKLLEISVGNIPDATRPFCGASDTTFAKNGHVFVSDGYCNGRFIEYDAGGKKLHEWGKKGKGEGEFNLVHDVSLTADNSTLYVADRENGRVQWFDINGKYLGEKHFGGQLFSVAIGPAGELYVGAHARGVGYDVDSYILRFDPKSGQVLGHLDAFAHQMSVGPDGTIVPGTVDIKIGSDPNSTSILVFRPKK